MRERYCLSPRIKTVALVFPIRQRWLLSPRSRFDPDLLRSAYPPLPYYI
jgi:hypothetical protein